MDSMSFKARYFNRSQRGTMGTDVDKQFDLESVSIDFDEIETVGPYALETVRPVGVVRAKEQPK
jgi:hypothetical protein